jgi:hypothetical protein
MTRRRAAPLVLCVLLSAAPAWAQAATPAPEHQSFLLWAAIIGPLLSTIGVVTVVLRVGRWTQRTELGASAVATQLANCRRECDAGLKELRDHGSDYSHRGFRDLRVEFARRESVEQEYRALRELMDTKLSAIDKRLGSIESRLEPVA